MSYKIEETFKEACQESAVSDSLVALVSMILDGTKSRTKFVVIQNLLQHSLHSE